MTDVVINLAGTIGGTTGDAQVDSDRQRHAGDDVVGILGQNGFLAVAGLAALVSITTSEANDTLIVNGGPATTTSRPRPCRPALRAHPRWRRRQ